MLEYPTLLSFNNMEHQKLFENIPEYSTLF